MNLGMCLTTKDGPDRFFITLEEYNTLLLVFEEAFETALQMHSSKDADPELRHSWVKTSTIF